MDLHEALLAELPRIPQKLQRLESVLLEKAEALTVPDEIEKLFSSLNDFHLYKAVSGNPESSLPLKVGVLFSGGPASGGHNVILGLWDALHEMDPDSSLVGFLGGPSGLIENRFKKLESSELESYANQGGFDLLGTGRTKIETEEQFASALKTVQKHQLDALLIIGGDDSNTNAAYLAEYFSLHHQSVSVIGCPKTIDGDLTSKHIETSFGFDSASKTYSELVGNLCRDAKSQGKYYFFVKLMGRSASHLVLECALQTQPNYVLISEEVQEQQETLASIVDRICRMIKERAARGVNHGVILIPEGLVEFIPEFKQLIDEVGKQGNHFDKEKLADQMKILWDSLPLEVQKQLLLERDPHGNVQLSKVETERLLIEMVAQKLQSKTFNAQPLFFGYEGRSCYPSLFDSYYGYALGKTAALLMRQKKTGMMAALIGLSKDVSEWEPAAVPLLSMMGLTIRKGKEMAVIQKSLVDLTGSPFLNWKQREQACAKEDHYLMPGPIQFFGPTSVSERITKTLALQFKKIV